MAEAIGASVRATSLSLGMNTRQSRHVVNARMRAIRFQTGLESHPPVARFQAYIISIRPGLKPLLIRVPPNSAKARVLAATSTSVVLTPIIMIMLSCQYVRTKYIYFQLIRRRSFP